ncbi:MAG: phytoene dehydrogenase [Pirellulaceae bacterium]|nr:MAG: phytoene dehydrogenase [Pirellulaceae bacterium]
MYDTVIIGAGMSGLAAGIRLAQFDRRVCIVEQHSMVGGLNSYYRLNGRTFDTGLHAVTNFAARNEHTRPLVRLMRQLRLDWDWLRLRPQYQSAIVFPDAILRFSNDPELLLSQVADRFPGYQDRVRRLFQSLLDYAQWNSPDASVSTRRRLAELIGEPLLGQMLLCPVMWYGNARPHDMDWGAFCVLFRSIFLEGLARPADGILRILRLLVRRYRQLGGELRLRSPVKRIVIRSGKAEGVELASGEVLLARNVVSSAGWKETLRLCGLPDTCPESEPRLSFVETIYVLNQPTRRLGHGDTMLFYNRTDQFCWQAPDGEPCDLDTGVVCASDNFAYQEDDPGVEPVLRITVLARYDRWAALTDAEYRVQKELWRQRIADVLDKYVPGFRAHVEQTDMFTPRTIRHFTWHDQGAVYGAPHKCRDGRLPVDKLYLCGTDQGLVGIVGAMTSGVLIANQYCLRDGDRG